ncbi:phage major capsid protein [Paenibacillus sp. EKM211P]|uniref:phage major capsid protein n=1 Tax=Paenibacillus sp. EKM211P TaxID=1683679 RepID=UPI0013E934C1|nr:phage major capsid protein [Paenibacillus sp. EKM211P]KAF6584992.1 phage major capsid protein [Paenibacillus sp. EKM211P]
MKNKTIKHPMNLQLFAETGTPTMQEMLQDRADLITRQRALLDSAKKEKRDFTEDEDKEFNAFEAKIVALDKQIVREEAVASREKQLDEATKPYRPSASVLGGNPTQEEKKDDAGFKGLGEFIHAMRFGDEKGRQFALASNPGQGGGRQVPDAFASQLLGFRNEWTIGGGAGAGQFLPTQFMPDNILQLNPQAAIVRPRATVIPAGDPPDSKITIPALDQGTNGVYAGVEVDWIEEGAEKPETGGKMSEVSLEPHEVAATTVVTDKLLRNWKAADTFIRNLLSRAMLAAEDVAFLTGNGTGKPLGVLNATGALTVNRKAANQISYIDVVNMLAKLLPESVGSAVFVAHQSTLPQLMTMQDPAGRYIFIQGDATKGIPSTLAGIPIRFTGRTRALGTKGDLQLVDFYYYLIKDGSGPFIDASEHVLFRSNKTVIKAFWNVDGKPWVISPLTLEDGATKVSPYVLLDVPTA